jgi:hypothetical protein
MKIVCIAIALILSFGMANAQCATPQGNREVYGAPVKGKVKYIRNYDREALNKADLETPILDTTQFLQDSFSNTGLLVCQYRQAYLSNEIASERYSYTYNANGKMIDERWVDILTGTTAHTTFIYDTAGNLRQKYIYSIEDTLCTTVRYTYASGQLVKKECCAPYGTDITTYVYFGKTKMMETRYSANGSEPGKIEYTYDDKGNVISNSIIGLSYITKYKYDQHNNKILMASSAPDNSNYHDLATEYTYDTQGNWIRRLEEIPFDFDVDKQYHLTIRQIEYY